MSLLKGLGACPIPKNFLEKNGAKRLNLTRGTKITMLPLVYYVHPMNTPSNVTTSCHCNHTLLYLWVDEFSGEFYLIPIAICIPVYKGIN